MVTVFETRSFHYIHL